MYGLMLMIFKSLILYYFLYRIIKSQNYSLKKCNFYNDLFYILTMLKCNSYLLKLMAIFVKLHNRTNRNTIELKRSNE